MIISPKNRKSIQSLSHSKKTPAYRKDPRWYESNGSCAKWPGFNRIILRLYFNWIEIILIHAIFTNRFIKLFKFDLSGIHSKMNWELKLGNSHELMSFKSWRFIWLWIIGHLVFLRDTFLDPKLKEKFQQLKHYPIEIRA